MRWFEIACGMAALNLPVLLVGLLVGTGAALAQEAAPEPAEGKRIPMHLMVTHLSNEEGGVDPRAAELDERLRSGNINYPSVTVTNQIDLSLGVDEVGTIELPNGRTARIQPMNVNQNGVLMAVEVEDGIKTDFRVLDDEMVIIPGGNYEDGKVVISVEPDYE